MGALDFLFEGKPPASTTTYGQTVQNLPTWMADYTQGLIAKANAVAAEPYQSYGGPRVAQMTPDQTRAFDLTRQGIGTWQPQMQQAGALAQVAGNMSPTSAASPYMQSASQTFPQAVNQYMDPYIGNVIDRAAQVANRNFTERIMPGINDQFVRGGQYGSSAHMREANRAGRDLTEGLQGQSLAALSSGYGQAGQLFGQDASRMGALAQTAGNLAGQEGQLKLSGAQELGALGQLGQSMGFKDAAALEAIGGQQQNFGQKNLDTAYQDFQNQTQYPRQTLDWMSAIVRGLPTPMATTSSQTGPASVYQPSPLAQLASLGTGLAGLSQMGQQSGG